ncbi:MAG: LAGLIDADG family homing endonuclease [Candidatus Daviesbacteria bacterium]|nr:LAGLIDADG family homing endonuclease [Candidatus Daviesbacteria bacterium]
MKSKMEKHLKSPVLGPEIILKSLRWPQRDAESFFDNWTRDMAYVLGYFASDGSMYRNKRGSYYISFTSADKELIETIKNIIMVKNIIEIYQPKGNTKIRYTLQIGSKKMFFRLLEIGFTPKKSLTLKLPIIPNNMLGHFLRGYFDGDGCAYLHYYHRVDRKNKLYKILTLRLTSGSEHFLKSLHKRLIEVVKIKGGSICSHSGAYTLSFSYCNVVKLYSFMYPELGLPCLERKRVILEKGIKNLGS